MPPTVQSGFLTRPAARAINEAIAQVGGLLDAGTAGGGDSRVGGVNGVWLTLPADDMLPTPPTPFARPFPLALPCLVYNAAGAVVGLHQTWVIDSQGTTECRVAVACCGDSGGGGGGGGQTGIDGGSP